MVGGFDRPERKEGVLPDLPFKRFAQVKDYRAGLTLLLKGQGGWASKTSLSEASLSARGTELSCARQINERASEGADLSARGTELSCARQINERESRSFRFILSLCYEAPH